MSKFHEEKRAKQAEIAYKYTNAQIQKIQDDGLTLEQVVEAAYKLGDVKSVLLKVGR